MAARDRSGSDVFDDFVWGVAHDAFIDPTGRVIAQLYQTGMADPEIIGLMRGRVDFLKRKAILGDAEPFRKPRLQSGDLMLGVDRDGDRVFIDTHSLNTGLLCVGNSGSTKTNWLKFVLLQLLGRVPGLWLTDLYKRELRHMRPLAARKGVDLIVLTADRVRFNPLQADGCDPRGYLPVAIDLIARSIDAPPRARTILTKACYDLYERFGVFEGSAGAWPTLFDVFEWVQGTQGLNAQARESLLDRLGAVLVALGPGCLAYRSAWKPSDLTRHAIVFEMRGTSEAAKSLLTGYFLQSTMHSRVERGCVNPALDLLAIWEDCQRFFAARDTTGSMSPVEELSGLIRGTGTGLGGLAQSMRGLSGAFVSNTSTKIMGRLGSHADYAALGADMGMTHEQIRWAQLNLGPGVFVCQVAEGRWRRPLSLRVPRLDVPAVVTEEEARRSAAPLLALRTERAHEFDDWRPSPTVRVTESRDPAQRGDHTDTHGRSLDEAELAFLRAVIETPGLRTSDLVKRLKMGQRRIIAIRRRLVERGYLREHEVATGGRGRPSVIVEPLEPALRAAGSGNGP